MLGKTKEFFGEKKYRTLKMSIYELSLKSVPLSCSKHRLEFWYAAETLCVRPSLHLFSTIH